MDTVPPVPIAPALPMTPPELVGEPALPTPPPAPELGLPATVPELAPVRPADGAPPALLAVPPLCFADASAAPLRAVSNAPPEHPTKNDIPAIDAGVANRLIIARICQQTGLGFKYRPGSAPPLTCARVAAGHRHKGRFKMGVMGRPPELPDHSLSAKWYSQAPTHSVPPPSLRPPPPPIGHPGWSLLLGSVAGALGGFVGLLAAQFAAFVGHSRFDFVAASRGVVKRVALGHEFVGSAFVLPVVAGAVLGALLGFLSRRLLRVLPRLLFFSLLLPTISIFVYAIVMRRFAPTAANMLPFGPIAIASLVYGSFLAVVSPIQRS